MKRRTTEEYIELCKKRHNSFYIYNPETIGFINNTSRIKVTCPIHSKFKVSADAHLRLNCGCQKCGCGRHTFAATQLFNFIQSYFNDAVQEKTIDILRLDIYIPSLNTANYIK